MNRASTFDFTQAKSKRLLTYRQGCYQYDTFLMGAQDLAAFYSQRAAARDRRLPNEKDMIACGEEP